MMAQAARLGDNHVCPAFVIPPVVKPHVGGPISSGCTHSADRWSGGGAGVGLGAVQGADRYDRGRVPHGVDCGQAGGPIGGRVCTWGQDRRRLSDGADRRLTGVARGRLHGVRRCLVMPTGIHEALVHLPEVWAMWRQVQATMR